MKVSKSRKSEYEFTSIISTPSNGTLTTIVLLAVCVFFACVAILLNILAFYNALHIPLNYVSPSPITSPTFQAQLGVKSFQNSTEFYPLLQQTITYKTPFESENPFLVVNSTSELSGQPCQSQILSATLTQFQAQIFNCPTNGYIVNNVANTVINPSMTNFIVGNDSLPGVLYALNTKLYYQLAKNIDGTVWNAPVLVASVPSNATVFKLLNFNGQPTAAWVDNSNKFYFAQTTTHDWSTFSIGPIEVTPGYNLSTVVFDFLYVNGQPSVIVQNSSTNDLNFIRSSDDGTTWTTSTLIVAATQMLSVSSAVVNSYPSIMAVTTANAMNFYRAASNIGGTPWTATSVYGSGISAQNLTLSNVGVVATPIVWAYNGTHQFFLVADDINGASWTTANAIQVNSTNSFSPSPTSRNGHFMINNFTTLLMSYIDQSDQLQFMTITTSQLSAAADGTNASPMDPGVLHTATSSNIALIGGGIAFIYVPNTQNQKLLYFRPINSFNSINTQYTLTYTAIGSVAVTNS